MMRSDQIGSRRSDLELEFPEFSGRMQPFGFDWLGRVFAFDSARLVDGEPQILMLEVGAGEAMEIPVGVEEFHNGELVDYAQDLVALQFWMEWSSVHRASLEFSECAGYKVPLFLGGEDSVANLECIDAELYWSLCAQLRRGVLDLPAGHSIKSIGFKK